VSGIDKPTLDVCREAGCTPFATSLLADYFDEGYRASALGVYNWGIYVGFSLTYAIGNFVTDANLFGQVRNLLIDITCSLCTTSLDVT